MYLRNTRPDTNRRRSTTKLLFSKFGYRILSKKIVFSVSMQKYVCMKSNLTSDMKLYFLYDNLRSIFSYINVLMENKLISDFLEYDRFISLLFFIFPVQHMDIYLSGLSVNQPLVDNFTSMSKYLNTSTLKGIELGRSSLDRLLLPRSAV